MDPAFHKMTSALNSAMEDLSVSNNKQLPYRQQREKPLLKYSNSEPGPIYLYQNPDLQNPPTSSAPNSPAKGLSHKHVMQSGHTSQYGSAQYTYVPSPDPYARPLSAKDLMTLGLERTKSLNHIMSTTLAGNLANSMHATNVNNNSALYKPKRSELLTSIKDITASDVSSHHAISTTKVVSVQSSEANTIRTQSAKEKFEASLSKPPIAPDRGVRPPSSLRRPQSSTVRNPNYSPSKPYDDRGGSEDEDFKMVSDSDNRPKKKVDDNLNNKVAKAISNLSKTTTNARSNSFSKLSSSNESLNDKASQQPSTAPTSASRPSDKETVSSETSKEISKRTLVPTDISSLADSKKTTPKRLDSATSYYL